MKRFFLLLVLGGAGIALTPALASAQFGPPIVAIRPLTPLPTLNQLPTLPTLPALPALRPLGPIPNPYAYIPRVGVRVPITPYGNIVVTARSAAVRSSIADYYAAPYVAAGMISTYGQGGSYITGSANINSDAVFAAQRNLAKAQRDAKVVPARDEIAGQWNFEKRNNPPAAEAPPPADPIRVALAPTDFAMVTSGKALNPLVEEIARAEAKGAKGPSAYIPPLLLDDMRFSGAPAGDLLNLARQAGNLEFPPVFTDPALAALGKALEKDFATAAVAVQAGKSPEPDKIAKLEVTFQKVQDAATPVVKNLPFDEAIAARRFLNQMAGAIKGMKAGAGNGLIDPKWSAEGLTVSDLVKHMTRHKLLFAVAPRGGEESYATMHRNLATYLLVLDQMKK